MTTHRRKLEDLILVLEKQSQKNNRRVIVDFDHTLFLSNSTEEFLNTVRPAFLAALILNILAVIRPWQFLSQDKAELVWRDAIRVWVILLLMPWSWLKFRAQARSIFGNYKNNRLIEVLRRVDTSQIVIVSFGFSFVIRAMLRDSRFGASQLHASSLRHPVDLRKKGKAAWLRSHVDGLDSERDLIITDSDKDDADLLNTYHHAFHIRWPNEVTRHAHHNTYVPFFYTIKVKRSPGFFFKQVLLEDLPVFLLAYVVFEPPHWTIVLFCVTLFLTIQMVHEIGYVENDRIGYLYERDPKLSHEFESYKRFQVEPQVWFWVAALTAFAVASLDSEYVAAMTVRLGAEGEYSMDVKRVLLAFVWMGCLLAGRAAFFFFNHAPLAWRIFAYFPLQVIKYFSPSLLFASAPAGIALLCAQVTRTWSLYAIRRCGGDIDFIASQLVRLVFFFFFLVIVALSIPTAALFTEWQTWLLIFFCLTRAAPEFRRKLLTNDVTQSFVPFQTGRKLLQKLDCVDEMRRKQSREDKG